MSRVIAATTTLAVCIALAVAAPAAHAETQVNASGACKSALPVFDGNIRSRPLGVRNEGTANAFVSCSVPAEHGSSMDIAALYLTNSSDADLTVSCTFVNGRNSFSPQYAPGNRYLLAGTSGWLVFFPDTSPPGGDLANFSCNLPPGTEINMVVTVPPAT